MNYWAESMLLWSGQTLLLVGALFLVTAMLRRGSAADRYRVWLVGLLIIASLPAANLFITTFPVAVPVAEPVRYVTSLPQTVALPPERDATAIATAAPSVEPQQAATFRVPSLVTILFLVWIAGVLVYLYRPFRSYLESRRFRATAVITPMESLRVLVGYSSGIRSPMLAGIFRPMILLPADIASWADPAEQHAIVLHEAAHFERRDHLVNLVQTLIGAILFFHPAVRYALRQLVLERELACDERVLGAGAQPAAYAEVLMKVAERTIAGRDGYEPAFNTAGKILDRRMTMILNHRPALNGSRLARASRAAAVCVVAFLLLPERAVIPESPLSLPVLVAAVPAVLTEGERQSRLDPKTGGTIAAPFDDIVYVEGDTQGILNREYRIPIVGRTVTLGPEARPTALAAQAVAAPVAVQPPAQQLGSLSGTIYDMTGAVIPGVTVRLFNSDSGFDRTAVTNERGLYGFPQVNPGQYTFEARLPGFSTYSRPAFVRAQSEVADAVLQLGGVTTHVEVSVAAPQAPLPPPPAAAAQTPLRVGGDIAAPQLIFPVKPAYPPEARARLVQGSIKLEAVIGADGTVKSLYVNPSGGSSVQLIQAAIDAVKQWRYRPALLNGVPVDFPTSITVDFTMQ